MSFPNTVDAVLGGAEQPGRFATFLNGTDRYQVQFSYDPSESQLIVKKSTDRGVTWSTVDGANGPLVVTQTNFYCPYTVVQIDAATLLVIYVGDTVGLTYTTFTMGAVPAWSGANTPAPTPPSSPVTGEDGLALPQIAAQFRASDNSVLVVIVGDLVTLSDVLHSLCVLSVIDVGGGTWGGWQTLGYEDYPSITTWDMVPCGVAVAPSGKAVVFMQQVSRAGPGTPQSQQLTASGSFDAPDDATDPAAAVICFGPGGGSGGDESPTAGGGGGGGGCSTGTVALVGGVSYPVTVGTGGAPKADGSGPTVFGAISAGPGLKGLDGDSVLGGAGGGGDFTGGAGGASGTSTGGGGGGVAGPAAGGGDGGDGGTIATDGGVSGAAGDVNFDGIGGPGGNRTPNPDPPYNGTAGTFPGGGGGGQGSGLDPNAGNGADGMALLSWISVRNTNNGRLFQQTVFADNTLGAIHEVTQGAFLSRTRGAFPIPLSFDCAADSAGRIWIAFTGAISTSGRNQVGVGKGASAAEPVAFSFQDFSSGNGGSNIDASPALAVGAGVAYCCYLAAPLAGALSFLYRADFGSGFGVSVLIGSIVLPDSREFGRLQASVLDTLPEITFGVPTVASLLFPEPE